MKKILTALILLSTLLCVPAQALLFPGQIFGTISLRQAYVGFVNQATTNVFTFTSAPTNAGDFLVCGTQTATSTATATISDAMTDTTGSGGGSVWTTVAGLPYVEAANSDAAYYMWWRRVGSNSNSVTSVSVAIAGGSGRTVCGNYKTTLGTFYPDGTPTFSTGNGTQPNPGNITISSPSSLIVVMINGNAVFPTAGSGYTAQENTSNYLQLTWFDSVSSASAGSTSTQQVIASNKWTGVAAAFSAR